jgi:hypothetical protein
VRPAASLCLISTSSHEHASTHEPLATAGARMVRTRQVNPPSSSSTARRTWPAWALDLAFARKALRDLCASEAKATLALGAKVTRNLRARLTDIRAANSMKDVLVGARRQLEAVDRPEIALRLGNGVRVVLRVNHSVVPRLQNGNVEWSKVSRVQVMRFENENE